MSGPVAIVLSGGGARGAYEAGVIGGLVEALGLGPGDPSPFQIVSGTSVGAINGAFVVGNADRGDLAAKRLAALWTDLRVGTHLRIDPLGLLLARARGHSLLDPRALEVTVRSAIRWETIHEHVASGLVHAFVIAALHISSGRTTLFADVAPGQAFRPTPNPRLVARFEPIGPDHVLASAAIPIFFPARRVGDTYYCDGGIRFNTPMAPAIRAGAERLVVVSLRHETPDATPIPDEANPSPLFLLGKVLNALLLDPVAYDLQVLGRFNRLVEVLEATLDDVELARVARVLAEERGLPYRKIRTLVFTPSEDIGKIAAEHLREHLPTWKLPRTTRWALEAATRWGFESDAASYLLFDGEFAEKLVALGRRDALARAARIRAFFA